MTKSLIFTISTAWDDETAVWIGHCDDIPAAADAPTLDELLAKISMMTLDLLPDNHPGVDPASVYLQIIALREAESVADHPTTMPPAPATSARGTAQNRDRT
jgi:hypothetical protein